MAMTAKGGTPEDPLKGYSVGAEAIKACEEQYNTTKQSGKSSTGSLIVVRDTSGRECVVFTSVVQKKQLALPAGFTIKTKSSVEAARVFSKAEQFNGKLELIEKMSSIISHQKGLFGFSKDQTNELAHLQRLKVWETAKLGVFESLSKQNDYQERFKQLENATSFDQMMNLLTSEVNGKDSLLAVACKADTGFASLHLLLAPLLANKPKDAYKLLTAALDTCGQHNLPEKVDQIRKASTGLTKEHMKKFLLEDFRTCLRTLPPNTERAAQLAQKAWKEDSFDDYMKVMKDEPVAGSVLKRIWETEIPIVGNETPTATTLKDNASHSAKSLFGSSKYLKFYKQFGASQDISKNEADSLATTRPQLIIKLKEKVVKLEKEYNGNWHSAKTRAALLPALHQVGMKLANLVRDEIASKISAGKERDQFLEESAEGFKKLGKNWDTPTLNLQILSSSGTAGKSLLDVLFTLSDGAHEALKLVFENFPIARDQSDTATKEIFNSAILHNPSYAAWLLLSATRKKDEERIHTFLNVLRKDTPQKEKFITQPHCQAALKLAKKIAESLTHSNRATQAPDWIRSLIHVLTPIHQSRHFS